MTEIVWAILWQNSRFLLAQQLLNGIWDFPGGEKTHKDQTTIIAVYQKLKKEVGLKGKRFRKLFHMYLGKNFVQVFWCDQWYGELKPACENIIGIGWFTIAEMHALGQSLNPFVNESLPYLTYLIQHYNNHPGEWKEQWEKCDESG